MNQTIAPLFDCDFLLNTMPPKKKNWWAFSGQPGRHPSPHHICREAQKQAPCTSHRHEPGPGGLLDAGMWLRKEGLRAIAPVPHVVLGQSIPGGGGGGVHDDAAPGGGRGAASSASHHPKRAGGGGGG